MDVSSPVTNLSLQFITDVSAWMNDGVINQTTHSAAQKCRVIKNDTMISWNHPGNVLTWQTEELFYKISCGLLMPILFLLGTPANILNMIVFYKQGLKERINVSLFILSLVDIMYIIPIFFYQIELLGSWATNVVRNGVIYRFMMNHDLLFFYGFRYGSMFLAAVISTERCIVVLFPLTAQRCVPTKVFAVVIVFFVFLLTLLRFLFVPKVMSTCFYEERTQRTSWQYIVGGSHLSKDHILLQILECVFIGLCFAIACPVLVFFTTVITAIKLRQIVRWRSHASSAMSSPKEIAVTKMLICLSVEFLILSSPGTLLRVRRLFPSFISPSYHKNLYRVLTNCSELSFYISSSVNFLVYYCTGTKYKETLHAVLGIKTADKKTRDSNSSSSSSSKQTASTVAK